MVLSMTGFGKAEATDDFRKISIELKSLNSRNADIKLKFPPSFRKKEFELRTLISKKLTRGKIDVTIELDELQADNKVVINEEKFKLYYDALSKLIATTSEPATNLFALALKMPEVIEAKPEDHLSDNEWQLAQKVLDGAMNDLNLFRQQEGEALAKDLKERVNSIVQNMETIEKIAPERAKIVEERLTQKIEELKELSNEDKERMHQEVVYYLEKYDINEEIVRLRNHCKYFNETLLGKESNGKKLGFIAQEMGREINTIGSKANHSEIQKLVVNMKDELEKIKEQSLNVL